MPTKSKNQRILEQLRCSNANEIGMFLHCGLCLRTVPAGESPRSWAQLEVGCQWASRSGASATTSTSSTSTSRASSIPPT